jgi:hypothetical protein
LENKENFDNIKIQHGMYVKISSGWFAMRAVIPVVTTDTLKLVFKTIHLCISWRIKKNSDNSELSSCRGDNTCNEFSPP